jgi:molybdenum cofactor cytidylyltransferase
MLLKLSHALRVDSHSKLAFTGAGGKTAAMFQLARQLPPPVLAAATTHLALHQLDLADRHFTITSPEDCHHVEEEDLAGVTLFTGPNQQDGRTSGLDEHCMFILNEIADKQGLPLLVEADGSRQRPVKAPAPHEPAVPHFVDTVVVVAGLSALGRPLTSEYVHRPELFAHLADQQPGEIISPESLARVLLHSQGGLKGIPYRARRIALLTQVSSGSIEKQARLLANSLLPVYSTAAAAELTQPDPEDQILWIKSPAAGIILAAGRSKRFGEVKQLLPWRGEPLVRRASRLALEAGLSPVVVVTGFRSAEVSASLQNLPVRIVYNPLWESGQSTSISAGIKALPPEAGSALFILTDQPRISSRLLQELVDLHARTGAPIAAPRVEGKRTNPVLFDSSVFPELLKLEGDVGGRVLFSPDSHYHAAWLDWHDRGLLLDIDTPEDYQKLKNMEEQA